jgi:hypothetical protein
MRSFSVIHDLDLRCQAIPVATRWPSGACFLNFRAPTWGVQNSPIHNSCKRVEALDPSAVWAGRQQGRKLTSHEGDIGRTNQRARTGPH